MRECDNSKIHINNNSLLSISFNNFGHLITSTITTLQHFATLNHTKPNYTSLHLRHFTSSHLHFTTLPFGLTHLYFLLIFLNVLLTVLPSLIRQTLCRETNLSFRNCHYMTNGKNKFQNFHSCHERNISSFALE